MMGPGFALHEVVAPRDSVLSAICVPDVDHGLDVRIGFIEISDAGQDIQYRFRRDIWYGSATDVLNVQQMLSECCDDFGSRFCVSGSPSVMC
jgi:hypothetical protein